MDKKKYLKVLKLLSKNRIEYHKDRPYILLDGVLDTSHNLFINVAIGLAVHEVYGYNVAFLTDNSRCFVNDIAASIGAEVININQYNPKKYSIRKIKYYWDRLKYRYVDKKDILQISIHDIPIGDLVYDSIIRFKKDTYTLAHFQPAFIKSTIADAIRRYHSFSIVLKDFDVKLLSLSHKFYVKFGIFSRVAINNKIPFISKSRAHLTLVNTLWEHRLNNYSIDHGIERKIRRIPESIADNYVKKRFLGEFKQNDVIFAYSSKKVYDTEMLLQRLSLIDSMPIAIVMLHAFSDAPHSDTSMLYRDYYEWFIETLHIIKRIEKIQWLIKPHPASSIFDEEGVVIKLIEETPNIKMVPPDVRTDSVLEIADAVITVRGTVGLECVLFDAQPILAGDAYYMNLGFTINCKTISEYKQALSTITKKSPIDESVKSLAKKVLYWRNESYLFFSGIFGPEMRPNLPKEELLKHELWNYQHVYDFLSENDYKSDVYYKKLIVFFSDKRKTLCVADLVDFEKVEQA